MTRSKWLIPILLKTFTVRFFLAKLTRVPGIRFIINTLLFSEDVLFYIPNDSLISKTNKIILLNTKIPITKQYPIPSEIIDNFIDKTNYIWKMNFCLCRTANGCQNYSQDFGCLFLGEAVLKIDHTLGKLITKAEAKEYLKKCQKQGLVQLIGRNKLDTQWLDIQLGYKLLTICNCCECCCLWKMLPNLDRQISEKLTRMPGIAIKVTEECIGCSSCVTQCFVKAISIKNGKAFINHKLCKGCGRCINICKQNAIKLIIHNEDFISDSIRRISQAVDVT